MNIIMRFKFSQSCKIKNKVIRKKKMNNPEFELVQVHENGDYAEIVVRDKNNFKVYEGKLDIVSNPKSYYPLDYMDKNNCFYDCEFCGCNTNARIRACCKKGEEADIEKKGKRYD